MVVTEFEEIGESLDAEFSRLVRASSHAVGACAHGEAANLDTARTELDAIGRLFGRTAREQMVWEIVQRREPGRTSKKEISTFHATIIRNEATRRKRFEAAEPNAGAKGQAPNASRSI